VFFDDADVKLAAGTMPISEDPKSPHLFKACMDGWMFCKLINLIQPDTVDLRVLAKGKALNNFTTLENLTCAFNSAKGVGINIVAIRPKDIVEQKVHLVLGILWQLIKQALFAAISVEKVPGIIRLLEPGETLQDLMALGPEAILLRWMNYHLKAAGSDRRVKNFTDDIKDSVAYTTVLNQISKKKCLMDPLKQTEPLKRAESMLQEADKIKCRKFVNPRVVVAGHQKLNLAFVAFMFRTCPALDPMEAPPVIVETREEKTFRNWLNSLGVNPFLSELYGPLTDGLILLQAWEKMAPGSVEQRRVEKTPKNPFQKLGNCGMVVEVGKAQGLSLVGVGGKNIYDKDRTLVLGLLFQMFKYHQLLILQQATGDTKRKSDDEIVAWANNTVKTAGKSLQIKNMQDPAQKSGLFQLALLDSIKPGCVDKSLIAAGSDAKEQMLNAKLAISITRKLGGIVFCLPEDFVEVTRMLTTFYISCWYVSALIAKGGEAE